MIENLSIGPVFGVLKVYRQEGSWYCMLVENTAAHLLTSTTVEAALPEAITWLAQTTTHRALCVSFAFNGDPEAGYSAPTARVFE